MPSITTVDLNNAKLDVDHIAAIATSTSITATDRLGFTKDTIAGAVYKIAGITNRGAWATATAYATKDIVLDSSIWYVCVVAHTSGATFAGDSANKWRVYQGVTSGDLAAPSGAGMVGWIRASTGAVLRPLSDKTGDVTTVKDFGGTWDGVADVSAVAQNALNSGAKVVDFLNLLGKINTALTVPAGVEARNVNLTAGTAGMNMMLVNNGSKVTGILTGTGTTSIVERGIYPATDGVADVDLDVTVQNLTFGVQAQNIGTYTEVNFPRRWTGTIRCKNIVGLAGSSEGYGVLLSPALDCNLKVFGKTIQRHIVYLSAGASWNIIDADVDGIKNAAVQFNTSAIQNPSQYNTVRVKARNLTVPGGAQAAGQAVGAYIIGNSHRNTVHIDIEGSGTAELAVVCEGTPTDINLQPTGNKFTGHINGQFIGADVVRDLGCGQNDYSDLVINGYATFSVIAFRLNGARSGPAQPWSGPSAYNNRINAQGQSIRAIYNEVTDVATYVGPNDIRNNGSSLRVDDRTGGKRTGYSRRVTFSGTTSSCPSLETVDTAVTLPDNIQTINRAINVQLTGSSVVFFNTPIMIVGVVGAASELSMTFRAYNGHTASQTFAYSGTVEGD